MKKVGRNDPCPCGSGKKYKKCHGASNVIQITPAPYNNELDELHKGLVDFTLSGFNSELAEVYERYPQYALGEHEELLDLYLTGLTTWAILYEPIQEDATIFDLYYKKEQNKVKHERVRQAFATWREVSPSVYEIISVNEEKVTLEDGRTNVKYAIAPMDPTEFEVGEFILGILIPYVEEHAIMYMLGGLPEEEMARLVTFSDVEMTEKLPEIVGDLLTMGLEPADMEWESAEHKMVADLFTLHASNKGADEEVVSAGTMVWWIYADKVDPIIRKPEAYAAALEYFVQNELLLIGSQSQKDLADEYGVSTTTISKHSRNMADELAEEMDEMMVEMDEVNEETEGGASFTTERMMRDIERALEGEEFESEDEVHEFLTSLKINDDFMPPPPETPREQAQDLLYEAFELSGEKRRKQVNEALRLHPNSPDAYLLMAEEANTVNESYQLVHQAVIAGEKDLGKAFIEENKGRFWGMIETRPYMRAKEELAHVQYELNHSKEAIATYEEMLELNPGDNQGIRYLLLSLYLETRQYDDGERLLEQYEEDTSTDFKFNKCLLYFYQDGLTSKTKTFLKEADKENPHVKDFLTGKKEFPRYSPESIRLGDESEAIVYIEENLNLWKHAYPLVGAMKKL